jgi:hypothetical protein
MADTSLTIITDAMLDIGVLAADEVPTAGQANQALRRLNNMIDSWNTENLAVYGAVEHILPLVAGQQKYTIGPGGDLDIPRPNDITTSMARQMSLPVNQRIDYPLYILNDQEWQSIPQKGLQSAWPNMAVYYNMTYPLIEAHVYPSPTTGEFSLVLWNIGILANLELNTVINLAPGYKRAMTANLCLEIAASYGVEVPPSVQQIAVSSKADIKTQNLQINEMSLDSELRNGRYNIFTDLFNR